VTAGPRDDSFEMSRSDSKHVGSLPSVSIILPFLNEERNLSRCLGSVAAQDYPPRKIEVLAADAGSVDRSQAVLASFRDRIQIRLVDNSARRGAEWGKALALQQASGDLVQCMDADMWLTSSSMLRTLVAPFEEEDVAGVVAPFALIPGLPMWSRFLSLDEFQRDPLLQLLTPDIQDFVVAVRQGHVICDFPTTRIPPIGGTTMFRREQIDVTRWGGHFRETDHPAFLVARGYSRFAYVERVAWGHLHCRTLGELVTKRRRNLSLLDTSFLSDVPRDFVWLEPSNAQERLRLMRWVIGTNLVVPRLLEGLAQAVRRRRWEPLLRPIAALAVVDALLVDMFTTSKGRAFLRTAISGKEAARAA
jgi:glycosyltransferase involved in cell wall biosynthesis